MAKSINLQDMFLNQVRKDGIGVTIYLTNSVQLRGHVRGFDAFTVLLDSPGKPTQLVYKHAVASIVPNKQIATYRPHGESEGPSSSEGE
ncbi:MAG: RNA chaperone Hfq [Armatimonadetes bacterium]|uniref:RNA-binding protein Hfq n=1 Tax=Candidatus Nitrosymbiomonas proteolyticus TaxID=2608984 RepID=A0A809R8Z8_9BACT|nr:MAG: RNA chaperone Hfq [Armatimonadota bacterium]KXK17784.1 MAG: RNA-binding protein Hfq [Armatimonadetes bacterium OLB18]MCK6632856.1 RNA chaperone Hfq [Fimbriimonadaceae bacterium]BBO23919.1 RNA-binding protein Hfq [Candidatus Nitrosymbiomonas proteolyticus]MBL1151834.1 RNA chaperone Hfq [Armatimonadota bacterium]